VTLTQFIELLRFWRERHIIISDTIFENGIIHKNRIIQLLKPNSRISSLRALQAFGKVFVNCQQFRIIPLDLVLELNTDNLIKGVKR
jgi:hypothetical protein